MDRLKIYIERESEKSWRRYMAYLGEAGNEKDFDRVMTFMFEDILPENEFKDEKSIYSRLTKMDKIRILDHPHTFFYKYMNHIFRKERNVDNLVVRSIMKSFQGFKQSLDAKKTESIESMKKIIYFFIEMKKSERILLQEKTVDFSFQNKSVLTTKLEDANELGEIFGRYLMASMFTLSSHPSSFYKDIFVKVENKDFDQWHPLLKYWIFLFVIITQLFHKKCDLTPIFDTRKVHKLLKEMSILTYTKSKQEEFRKIGSREGGRDRDRGKDSGRDRGRGRGQDRDGGRGGRDRGQGQGPRGDPRKQFFRQQGQQQQQGRPQQQRPSPPLGKPWQQQRGGGSSGGLSKDFMKYFDALKKKRGSSGKKDGSRDGKKREHSDRNPYVSLYNKMLKETKVYNVYTEGEKKDDTLYNIFVENPQIKDQVDGYYRKMLFGEDGPLGIKKTEFCEEAVTSTSTSTRTSTSTNMNRSMGSRTQTQTRKCDFKKKIPIIFAQQNPEAYFSVESELLSDKSGPKKVYAAGTKPEDIQRIMNTLKEKITFYKSSYIYDDNYFAIFMKELKRYQLQLIYLLYSLYHKKYLLYKTFSDVLTQVIKDVKDDIGNESNNITKSITKNNQNKQNKKGTQLANAARNNKVILNRLFRNNEENKGENGNQNRVTQNHPKKDILEWIMTQEYKNKNRNIPAVQRARYELIYEKLKKLDQYKEKVNREMFGTPEYNEERSKIDKYLQLLRREAEANI